MVSEKIINNNFHIQIYSKSHHFKKLLLKEMQNVFRLYSDCYKKLHNFKRQPNF